MSQESSDKAAGRLSSESLLAPASSNRRSRDLLPIAEHSPSSTLSPRLTLRRGSLNEADLERSPILSSKIPSPVVPPLGNGRANDLGAPLSMARRMSKSFSHLAGWKPKGLVGLPPTFSLFLLFVSTSLCVYIAPLYVWLTLSRFAKLARLFAAAGRWEHGWNDG
jgi:hypothetical protein